MQVLLSIAQVQEHLGLGRTTIYQLINTGELPIVRIRSRIRISSEDLAQFIESRKGGLPTSV